MSKITVTLGGKERALRYSLNTMIELEELGDSDENVSVMRQLRRTLWAGLRHEDPDLTEEQVGEMIDMRDFADIEGAITRAMQRDVPETPGQAQAKPRPPKAQSKRKR